MGILDKSKKKLVEQLHKPMEKAFLAAYPAMANALSEPIMDRIDWQGLEVKHTRRTEEARKRAVDVRAEGTVYFKEIVENVKNPLDTFEALANRVAAELSEKIRGMVKTIDNPKRIYIVKPYEALPDHTVLKQQKIGICGWMEVYVE